MRAHVGCCCSLDTGSCVCNSRVCEGNCLCCFCVVSADGTSRSNRVLRQVRILGARGMLWIHIAEQSEQCWLIAS